jgi:signal transduction histidine kinase
MAKIGLRSRLFISHLVVMLVGLVVLTTLGKFSSPRFFIIYLKEIEGSGYSIRQVRTQLIRGFESAWSRGALWSIAAGATAAAGLSYWSSRRIVQPLEHMEAITQEFASGRMDCRVPDSEIPELNRLASSFNRMAADLEGVEQRRRELITDLTHELRTPLTILEGYLEGLSDGTIESSSDVYERLARETNRLGRLVNDLQELSKLESGYFPIQVHPLDLQSLLTGLVCRFSDQLVAENSPTLTLDYAPDTPMVMADMERVEQILVNLISNALRYTPAGSVTVRVSRDKDFVWIAVIDTGMGIAPEDLPHVFERFWRADRSRDRHSGGTGVGLAISSRLVELQGGKIEVESTVDEGSIFRFSLPIADQRSSFLGAWAERDS